MEIRAGGRDGAVTGEILAEFAAMRTLAIVGAALLLCACTQEKTTTNATVGDTTTVQTTTHTETTTVPAIDTAATAEAKKDVKDAVKNAEHNTGTALEKAGKTLKKDAKNH